MTAADDVAACRAILARGSHSFALAGRALPPRARDDAAVLYAFCRVADDLVDGGGDPGRAVDILRARLDRIYAARPDDDPVDRAFALVVAKHRIPRVVFDALIEGFAWDAARRTYEQLTDVLAYATRVASTVGVAMTLLMERRAPATLARAADLGLAMQLTNIARDVGEDARNGRLYLPRAWLAEEGLDPAAFLAHPAYSPAVGRAVARLFVVVEEHYRRADLGIGELPWRTRWAIRAARLVYADIGRVVRLRGHDSVSSRAIVSTARKLALLARAARALLWSPRQPAELPPAREAAFLVEAVR